MAKKAPGMVYLVGAGPGDPSLLTRKGAALLARADLVVYDGLISSAVLDLCGPDTERVYAGKKHAGRSAPLSQEQITKLLLDGAKAGKTVVRLKGGDPFIFGRGADECLALAKAGVPFQVVPGVSAAAAVPAYAGIPLTARGAASTVAFATGHEADGKDAPDVDWSLLAGAGTIVLFMAIKTLPECAQKLIAAGKSKDTPAAVIYWGTTAAQQVLEAPLGELAAAVESAAIKPPALVVIGEVVALRKDMNWIPNLPLFGQRIAITRDPDRATTFAAPLEDLGAEVHSVAFTRFVEPDNPKALAAAVEALEDVDWVVFASRTAVDHYYDALKLHGLDSRAFAKKKIAAVGAATAAALERHGLLTDVIATRENADGLVEELTKNGVGKGDKVLLPRAAGGREEIATGLTALGAKVVPAPIYRTEPVSEEDPAVADLLAMLERGGASILFLAPSQVAAFFTLAGDRAPALLGACRAIFAIGATTQEALVERGVTGSVIPSSPGPSEFVSLALETLRSDPAKDS